MWEFLFDVCDEFLYNCWNLKSRCKSNFSKSEMAKKNIELKNKHQGKRCFIIGNGPSIQNQDLSFLENEIVFVTNDFWKYDGYYAAKPDYYCMFDSYYFDLKLKDVNKPTINGIYGLQKYEHRPQFIFHRTGKEIIENYYHWNDWASIYYVDAILHYTEKYSKEYDITRVVPRMRCVVQYAIMLASYMGFDTIYLLGIEQTNVLAAIETYFGKNTPRYAYEITDENMKEACDISKRCSLETILFSYMSLFHQYKLVYDYCAARGIAVYNCTPQSLVDCIPMQEYDKLFK